MCRTMVLNILHVCSVFVTYTRQIQRDLFKPHLIQGSLVSVAAVMFECFLSLTQLVFASLLRFSTMLPSMVYTRVSHHLSNKHQM